MTTLRLRLAPVAVLLVGLSGCEQHFPSYPPPLAAESLPASSSASAGAPLAAGPADAGLVAIDSSHALTVTICSSSPQPCSASETDASEDANYRVVFGSGRGAVRSRGQAMADLYQELRDRTASGERLDAETRAPGGAGEPPPSAGRSPTRATEGSGDALAQCAFRLLDLVDRAGEVTLDVVHGYGSNGCRVSLGRSSDGGTSECLIQEPERQQRPDKKGPGMSW